MREGAWRWGAASRAIEWMRGGQEERGLRVWSVILMREAVGGRGDLCREVRR